MKTQDKNTTVNFWDDVRETVLSGMRDLRDKGDELARQGRLRMEESQSERRLRHAQETLGQKCHEMLQAGEVPTLENHAIAGHCERIRYYQDELTRLRTERMTRPEPKP